jgi:hypothetical protein
MFKLTASAALLLASTSALSVRQVTQLKLAQQESTAVAAFVPNNAVFDVARLGSASERFFLLHRALGAQMDQVIADIKAKSPEASTENMQLLKDSLECSENLAKLFPEDIEGNMAELHKIASAFLNNAMTTAEGVADASLKAEIIDELAIIYAINETQHAERADGTSGGFIKAGEEFSADGYMNHPDDTMQIVDPISPEEVTPDTENMTDEEKIAFNEKWWTENKHLHKTCNDEPGATLCEITA